VLEGKLKITYLCHTLLFHLGGNPGREVFVLEMNSFLPFLSLSSIFTCRVSGFTARSAFIARRAFTLSRKRLYRAERYSSKSPV
jgi:hypothetical protein